MTRISKTTPKRINRKGAKERGVGEMGKRKRGGMGGKDMRTVSAVRTDKAAHIFDDPKDRKVHFEAKSDFSAHSQSAEILRSGNKHDAVRTDGLERSDNRQMFVRSTRRSVDDKPIKSTPEYFSEESSNQKSFARSSPHDGIVP